MDKYENLSKEELIKLLLEKDNTIALNTAVIQQTKEELDKTIIELRDLRIKHDQLILKYENQNQRVMRDTYNMFVKKSEHLSAEDEVINEAEAKTERKPGQKVGGHNFTYDLKATRTIIKELSEEERKCPVCGEVMLEIGEDRTKKIIKYPASYEVVEIVTKKYACKNPSCDSGIKQALSDDVFGHSPVTPSVVADIINMKYSLAVPLDRYSKYLTSKGIPLSTQCLSNYVLEAADILEPLFLRLKQELIRNKARVVHADETTVEVIDVKDREKCYMFVYTTTFYDNAVYIYDFSETRKTDKTEVLFKDYDGYLVCDRYAGYDKFEKTLKGIQRCMAHARRYFFDVLKGLSPKEAKSSKAKPIVEKFDKLFAMEKKFKADKLTVPEIEKARNTDIYQKAVDDLHSAIWEITPQPGSLLEKAVNYVKNSWEQLFTYRTYGYLEMSNNLAERAVKPFVIARKNFLFSKTVNGAQASGLLFSIIQTAKANGLCIDRYLDYVLTNISKQPIEDLLPWSDKLPNEVKMNLK